MAAPGIVRRFGCLERDRLIREYFARGFQYKLILCFLAAVHGICISLSTLKRTIRRLNLRKRGHYTSLWRVSRCLLVCFTLLGNVAPSQGEESLRGLCMRNIKVCLYRLN